MKRGLYTRAAGEGPGATGDFGAALRSLHATLKNARDFSDPWTQFHDELMTYDESVEGEENADDTQLTAILAAMGAKLLGERHEPHHKRFIHLAAHRFWHGTCQIGSRAVIFFYFEQDDLGLAGFCKSLTDPNIELMRFSVLALPAGAMPVRTRGQA